jgi:uncharacterized protein YbjT (DUF2867 family)
MILVLGASGTVGKQVVKALQAKGAAFRAAYRSEEQIDRARQAGVEAVSADYARPETLGPAMSGAEKVFFVTAPSPNLAELESNVVEAVRSAGTAHLVKLSVWGVEEGGFRFAEAHQIVERKVKESGLPYTFLRPNGFMQNMMANASTIKSQGAFYLPGGDVRVSEIDVRDIAAVAAAVLTGEGHEGRAYELSGPEALSHTERARILSDVLGREVKFVSPPTMLWKGGAVAFGLSAWQADGIIDLFRYYASGQAARITSAVKDVTGEEPRTFRRFVEDYATAFS